MLKGRRPKALPPEKKVERELRGQSLTALKRTARARAEGMQWAEVARALRVGVSRLQRLAYDHRDEFLKWFEHYETEIILEQCAVAGAYQMKLMEKGLAPGAPIEVQKLGESAAHSIRAHRAKLWPLRQVHEVGETVTSVVERLARAADKPDQWRKALPPGPKS